MQEDVTKEIDGTSYVFSYMAPSKALPLSVTIVKAVLGPTGSFVSTIFKALGVGTSMAEADLSQFDITTACEKLAANLSPQEFLSIANELLKTVSFPLGTMAQEKGGVEVKMDRDFKGRTKHLMKVLGTALEVNYADFFDDLAALGRQGKSLLSSLVKLTSSGPSGESSSPK